MPLKETKTAAKKPGAGIINLKLDAGILSLVLIFSIVIAILCSVYITAAYYYQLAFLKQSIDHKLILNAQSGINYLLAQNESTYTQSAVDLYGEGTDSVLLIKRDWGLFDIGIAKAFSGRHSFSKAAMIGAKPNAINKSALYLVDQMQPLAISGQTLIKGGAFLPTLGVKSAYVNRIGYDGSQLVYGLVNESNTQLPPINQTKVQNIKALLTQNFQPGNYNLLPIDELIDGESFPFDDTPTRYLYRHGRIDIRGAHQGNIIIQSSEEINISSQAQLRSIIVIAPKVNVAPGFSGNLQIFAEKEVHIGDGATLGYPSTVGVVTVQDTALIQLHPGSLVEGTVLMETESTDPKRSLLQIDEEAKIIGQTFVNGRVQHQGEVWGHITCKMFWLQTTSAVYENYLVDGVLDSSKLPDQYVGADLWSGQNQKAVIQWF